MLLNILYYFGIDVSMVQPRVGGTLAAPEIFKRCWSLTLRSNGFYNFYLKKKLFYALL